MSTRCLISAKIRGLVYTIYCHHDGYPEHIIPLLRDCYNTRDKIGTLLLLGNASGIYETLEECNPYCDGGENSESYDDNAPSVFKEFKPDTSFSFEYHWDGEKWLWREGSNELKPITEWKGGKHDLRNLC
jgi:hypothetical protein